MRAEHRALQAVRLHHRLFAAGSNCFLALYNLRKKLPYLPIGSSATWLQWHIYVGMGTIGIFGAPRRPNWPRGPLNITLAIVYLLTIGSGFVGSFYRAQSRSIGASRTRSDLPSEFQGCGTRCGSKPVNWRCNPSPPRAATTLADFYTMRLYEYFEQPRGWAYDLRPSTARRRGANERNARRPPPTYRTRSKRSANDSSPW